MIVHIVPSVICLQKTNIYFMEQMKMTVNLTSVLFDVIKR
jgi:hypothetical protein